MNAAEAQMYSAADDEAGQEEIRLELYAPPDGRGADRRIGTQRLARPGAVPRERARSAEGGGMARSQAQALVTQMAAEDARYGTPGR